MIDCLCVFLFVCVCVSMCVWIVVGFLCVSLPDGLVVFVFFSFWSFGPLIVGFILVSFVVGLCFVVFFCVIGGLVV